jgi:hypothetical protein
VVSHLGVLHALAPATHVAPGELLRLGALSGLRADAEVGEGAPAGAGSRRSGSSS